jgi:HPt (histidine-containing phosphotransfer) domain-containing protein
MSKPVDLENLRSMTDGDVEMEKILFEEFFSCFDSAIINMQDSCCEDKSENWRKDAHALKGISMNLGAMQLGELCKKAQDEHTADAASKNEMLKNIKVEYEVVRDFINNHCN